MPTIGPRSFFILIFSSFFLRHVYRCPQWTSLQYQRRRTTVCVSGRSELFCTFSDSIDACRSFLMCYFFLRFFSLLMEIYLAFILHSSLENVSFFSSPLSCVNLPQLLFQLISNTRFSYSYCYPRENLFKTIIKTLEKEKQTRFNYGSEESPVERMRRFSSGDNGWFNQQCFSRSDSFSNFRRED